MLDRSDHGTHGSVNISKAIYQSCDSYFYTLAEKLGISRIAKYATMLGLGQKTGIDLPQEVSGVMPSEEWKIKNFKQKWYAGETISVGIGQGAVATTPIQLARAVGAITSDGVLVRPHVAFPDQFPPGFKQVASYNDKAKIPIDQENWMTITDAMAQVVSPIGTAPSARLPGIDFAGKDGQRANHLQPTEGEDGRSEKKQVQGQRLVRWRHAAAQSRDCGGRAARRGRARILCRSCRCAGDQGLRREAAYSPDAGGQGRRRGFGSKQAEVAAVWHEGDAKNPDKMQAGRFTVPADGNTKPVTAAPGVAASRSSRFVLPALEATESHVEMAHPEDRAAAPEPADAPGNKS